MSIHLFPSQFCCPEIGTWEASGAITDSGTFERTGGKTNGSLPDCFCSPEYTGAFTEVFLLTSSQGTTVTAEEQLKATGEVFPPSTGVWQTRGTGAYARVSGHGTSQFFFTPQFDLALTGVLSKAD